MIKEVIGKLVQFQDITQEEASAAMNEIMSGETTTAQIGSFLTALRMKGETLNEITGCARVMREKAAQVTLSRPAIDIVGTGGDGANTFNISTACAFITAAAGVPVAKHGNRSVSSKCGSADVLETLGANINLTPEQATQCFDRTGLCFMFAPLYHSSMKYAAGPRRELGTRSIFNLLGPLSNPASAQYQLLGVYEDKLVEPMARVLMELGVTNALSVHSQDHLDEISVCAPTNICEVRGGRITGYLLHPEYFGFQTAHTEDIVGGNPEENAAIIQSIFSGKERGPKRDIVLLNAGAALYIANRATTIRTGVQLAAEALDSGAVLAKLEEYKRISAEYKEASA